jgi:murein DD-endopeptidase MepM/ murein hydrolase activator NlpD
MYLSCVKIIIRAIETSVSSRSRKLSSAKSLKCCAMLVSTLLLLTPLVVPASAQEQCGVVTSIAFPVDRGMFHIAQDFGVPSPRHQGRYHTGEDYYGGRNSSYGQPVRAIADGRVTYSAGNGWGRDGGVVIIEHRFPDGSIAYSQYGHMEDSATYPFPARSACVKGGNIIGMVGNARPAPHLHLEIRTNQPDIPGPGYTPGFPTDLGWVKPSQFIMNWGMWLTGAHRWHALAGGNLIAPPLELPDHSLMFLDRTRVRGLTPDGRILWRIILSKPAVGLAWQGASPMLVYADGSMQLVNNDATLGASWATGIALDSAPIPAGDLLVFHTSDNTLVAFGADRQSVVWRLDGVPPIVSARAASNFIALVTESGELLTVSTDGTPLNRSILSLPASLGDAADGSIMLYTPQGLWNIGVDGQPAASLENAPPGGEGSAALRTENGSIYLLRQAALNSAGTTATYIAYYGSDSTTWEYELTDVTGVAELNLYGNVLLVTTSFGNIVALQAGTGAMCNAVQVYGDQRSLAWHSLGNDGTLRLAVGDQLLGLDWVRFIGGCA